MNNYVLCIGKLVLLPCETSLLKRFCLGTVELNTSVLTSVPVTCLCSNN